MACMSRWSSISGVSSDIGHAYLGITQFGPYPPEIEASLQSLMSFVEYRINAIDDVARVASEGPVCLAHAPDPEEDSFESIIASLVGCPRVVAVNCHARPNDEIWLCAECSRRLSESAMGLSACPYCSANNFKAYAATFGLEHACKKLRAAAQELANSGKILLIENTYEPPELMQRLLARVPEAGFTLDVGHSMIYGSGPVGYLRMIGDRLAHLHLHDNHGGNSERFHDEHLPPSQGNADWEGFARELRAIRFSGSATFECVPLESWVRWWIAEMRLA